MVAIPPAVWCDVAHRNGVAIFGTLIFEWEAGLVNLKELLNANDSISRLLSLPHSSHLDGWFLNVECSIPDENDRHKLLNFVTQLRQNMKTVIGLFSEVIWYDSVLFDAGELLWQNQVNNRNKTFFDVSDVIFLNYNWKEAFLFSSSHLASHRSFHVFVGVDVFGRSTPGGGGFHTNLAVSSIV
jgi:mannosyl-glycoprotein endo-beta-N-acetylglucosaminidase